MNRLALFILLASLCTPILAQNRVVVETPAKSDTPSAVTFPGERRMVIDHGELIYQMQADSINKAAEDEIRSLIGKLERKFEDPQVEEEVGRLIGEVVMRQQMALLDLQIDRAISIRDTLLLKGLELALQELLQNSDVIREQVQKQLDALERELAPEVAPAK